MKKVFSLVLAAMTAIALSSAAFADIPSVPRPEPKGTSSPLLLIVVVAVVIAAVAILIKVFSSKKK